MLCFSTARNSSPSCPCWPVTAQPITSDCAAIILPITPPALLAAHIRIGLSPSLIAVIFCRLPKSAFAPASVPLSATQPPDHGSEERKRRPRVRQRHPHG